MHRLSVMLQRLQLRLLLAALTGWVFLTACATAPVQEMSDARQAVAAAAAAGAERKAVAPYTAAREALAAAEKAVRNVQFKQARTQALKARELAVEAQQQSQREASSASQ